MSFSKATRVVPITQGGLAVSSDPLVMMTTVLGSCIAACLHDPVVGVGGMNHFLLPGDRQDPGCRRYGQRLTELLLEEMLRQGARSERIQAKLFGGGQMIAGMVDIGAMNSEFAEDFLATAGIPVLSRSTGGERARRLRFWPQSGRVQQLTLDPSLPEAR